MKKSQKIIPISSGIRISAKINIPGSKSITNRAFLLSALSVLDAKEGEHAVLNDALESNDTKAFCECLRKLGFEVLEVAQNKYKISAISKDNLLKIDKPEIIISIVGLTSCFGLQTLINSQLKCQNLYSLHSYHHTSQRVVPSYQ